MVVSTPTRQFANSFIMTRCEVTDLAQLGGRKVGVPSETGQTSVAARIAIEKAGATATYLPLVTVERICAALAAGDIDAGALPVDLRFDGQTRYGWNAFALNEFGTPSVFATTRKLIATNHELVKGVMQSFVEMIHLFKTRPDIVVPMLQRYLNIADHKTAQQVHAFHVPLFHKVPRPSFPGLATLSGVLVKRYPAAASLNNTTIANSSFIDELERSEFIQRLYAEHAI